MDTEQRKISDTMTDRQDELLFLLFFPCFLIWCELLLLGFAGGGMSMPPAAALPAAAGAGAVLGALFSFSDSRHPRAASIAAGVLCSLIALLFTVESMIRTIYTTYMTPANLLSGAGSVAENYTDELLRSILPGVFRFLLFLLPAAVVLGHRLLTHHGQKLRAAKRGRFLLPLTAGLLLIYGSTVIARTGSSADLFGEAYSYNGAVEAFGLLTATGLDTCYGIFGNPETSFSETDAVPPAPTTAAAAETVQTAASAAVPETETAAETGSETAAAPESDSDTAAAETEAAVPPAPAYNVMDIDFSRPELNADEETAALSAYLAAQEPTQKNEYTGLFAGKNLILVCAESYCDRFITPELTPTLWRLTHNGFYFAQYYHSEWGGSTTTGELAFVTGLCGNNGDESLSDIADNNHYFTMGNQLQRLGYSSIAFHSGYYQYYKRHTTHENLGYNQFLGVGNGIENILSYEYAPDSDLFANTIPLYIDHQPFSVYYMTLSGHAPYESSSPLVKKYYEQVDAAFGDTYEKKTKYYICYQMELEAAMTILVQRLEEAGIADDTVIALTGDHYPYGLGRGSTWKNDQDYIKDLLKTDDFFRWDQDRGGLIIWSGCLEHAQKAAACTIEEPVGNLDILPTLSNLFGLTYDSRLLPGRDVFAPDREPLVFWNNFSFVAPEGNYDGRKLNYYPKEGYEWTAEDPEWQESMHARVNDRLLMARTIMKTDYYGLLFGEDDVTQAGDLLWMPEEDETADSTEEGS